MNLKLVTLLFTFSLNSLSAQTTEIPDQNFEQALIDLGYDSGIPDGFVNTDSISSITFLDITSQNISSLTGLEDFIALDTLFCSLNQLTELDVSQNVALEYLNCSDNQLSSLAFTQNILLKRLTCFNNQLSILDVSQNVDLENLDCSFTQLTELDISQNAALKYLSCASNQLSTLDVTQNALIESISCFANQISTIDFTQNPNLEFLWCSNNQLNTLDFTQNISLEKLLCSNNNLTEINLSQCTMLRDLWCSQNELTHLNVSSNTSLKTLLCGNNELSILDLDLNTLLTEVSCYDNQLICLSLRNGNNSNFELFRADNNPDLTCIEVDDEVWSTANWLEIDTIAAFSNQCNSSCIVGNSDVENNESNYSYYPNPSTGNVFIDVGRFEKRLNSKLVNNLGEIIFQKAYFNTDFINIKFEAPKGIYLLILESSSGEIEVLKILNQ